MLSSGEVPRSENKQKYMFNKRKEKKRKKEKKKETSKEKAKSPVAGSGCAVAGPGRRGRRCRQPRVRGDLRIARSGGAPTAVPVRALPGTPRRVAPAAQPVVLGASLGASHPTARGAAPRGDGAAPGSAAAQSQGRKSGILGNAWPPPHLRGHKSFSAPAPSFSSR